MKWERGITEDGFQRMAQSYTESEDPGTLLIYKPNGDEAGEWSWEEVKNWAEGNIGARDFDNWMWKAKDAFDSGDGKALGEMIFKVIYRYSNKIKAQGGSVFVFNVGASKTPGQITGGDTVTITIDSGNPGGEPGEFENYMQKILSDWYDTDVSIG